MITLSVWSDVPVTYIVCVSDTVYVVIIWIGSAMFAIKQATTF